MVSHHTCNTGKGVNKSNSKTTSCEHGSNECLIQVEMIGNLSYPFYWLYKVGPGARAYPREKLPSMLFFIKIKAI